MISKKDRIQHSPSRHNLHEASMAIDNNVLVAAKFAEKEYLNKLSCEKMKTNDDVDQEDDDSKLKITAL